MGSISNPILFRPNSGPIPIDQFRGFAHLENIRNSNDYKNSWQSEWRCLWLRRSSGGNKSLNYSFMEKYLFNGTSFCPQENRLSKLWDAKRENYVLINPISTLNDSLAATTEKPLNHGYESLEEFLKFAENSSHGLSYTRDRTGINKLTNDLINEQTICRSLEISSIPTLAQWEDELLELEFDNPLRLLGEGDNTYQQWPTIQAGASGIAFYKNWGPLDGELPKINVSHKGCTGWVLVHPKFTGKLRHLISTFTSPRNGEGKCCDFLQNKAYGIRIEQLEGWGIPYTILIQEEGDIVVTFPDIFYATYNLEFCINTSMSFLTLSRELLVQLEQKLVSCTCTRRKCEEGPSLFHNYQTMPIRGQLDKIVWEWMEGKIMMENWHFLPGLSNIGWSSGSGTLPSAEKPQHFPSSSPDLFDSDEPSLFDVISVLSPNIESTHDTEDAHNHFAIYDTIDQLTLTALNLITFNGNGSELSDLSSASLFSNSSEVVGSSRGSWSMSNSSAMDLYHSDVSVCAEDTGKETVRTIGAAAVEDAGTKKKRRKRRSTSTTGSHTCALCQETLSNKAHLQRHIFLLHSPQDISKTCQFCSKKFANSLSLNKHLRGGVDGSGVVISSRRKNWCRGLKEKMENDSRLRCALCGTRFSLKSSYNRHLRNKHAQAL